MEQEQQYSTESEPKKESHSESAGTFKYAGWMVLLLLLIIGSYYGYQELAFIQTHVDTEDAQTAGYVSPVLPRISGYVQSVHVKDNQHVKKGQVLVRLDTTEFALKVDKARLALQNVKANLDVQQSSLKAAEISLQKARRDFKRSKDLFRGGATTRQKYDDAHAAFEKAQANYETAKQQVGETKTRISEKKNALQYAKLQLSYTTIKAPSSGVISKKDIEVGQLIQPGQPLMSITNTKDVWVVANFKETQIQYIKPGQQVDIVVDAYPDEQFQGTVESLAGGTGAQYALLPPNNATGNFVKVVQRVPVKILLNDQTSARHKLRLGLNVTTTIDITQKVDSSATAELSAN